MKPWPIIRFGLGVLAVGVAVRAVVRQWESLDFDTVAWSLSPGWIGLALLAAGTAYGVLILGWRRTLRRLGEELSFRGAVHVWLLANLGKYLPGKAWTFAASAALARDHAVDPLRAFSATVIMHLGSFAAAALVLSLDPGIAQMLPRSVPGALRVASLLCLGACALAASPAAAGRIAARLPERLARLLPVPWDMQLHALAANLVGWLLFALSLGALSRGIAPADPLPWDRTLGPLVLANLAGFVAVVAPGGIGVRESVLVVLLGNALRTETAIALAVVSRILVTVLDLAGGALAVGVAPRSTGRSGS